MSPEFLLPDTSAINFDSQGNLISLTDKNAKSISYNYSSGRLSSISAGAAGAISISYTGDTITSVTGPGPRTISKVMVITLGNALSSVKLQNKYGAGTRPYLFQNYMYCR